MINLAENIRKYRKCLGLSETELAKQAGLACSVISNYEMGHRHPSVKNLVKLAKALETSIDALVNGATREVGINNELSSIYITLNSRNRKWLTEYARFLETRQNKGVNK